MWGILKEKGGEEERFPQCLTFQDQSCVDLWDPNARDRNVSSRYLAARWFLEAHGFLLLWSNSCTASLPSCKHKDLLKQTSGERCNDVRYRHVRSMQSSPLAIGNNHELKLKSTNMGSAFIAQVFRVTALVLLNSRLLPYHPLLWLLCKLNNSQIFNSKNLQRNI